MNKWVKTSAILSSTLILGSSLATVVPVTANAASNNKTIHWLETADMTTMDPSQATDHVAFDALQATGEGLYRNDKDGKPQLALATSVDKSDDGLTYTFHLRDAKWSNGQPVTAQDFVYGWQRTNDPKTASQYAYLFSGIKNADDIQAGKNKDLNSLGVKALDDHTLEVTLEHPMPQLDNILTMAPFFPQNEAFVNKVGKKYGTAAKYTLADGPFTMTGWNGSNSKYSFVKNPDYWDAGNVKAKKIDFQTVKDANTGYNLYNSGKADVTYLSAAQVKASKNKAAYKVIPQASTFYLEYNQKKVPAFRNQDVRKAISDSINRKQLSDNVLTGSATPATTFTSSRLAKDPNTGEDFAKSAEVKGAITYNPTEAKKLWKQGMKEVGKKSLKVQLLTDDTDKAKQSAEFLQSQMQKLPGLKVSIKQVPFKQRLSLSQNKNFDMVITAWGADYADPSTFLELYTTGASNNNGSWSSATYDNAVKAATTTDAGNETARFNDYKTAEQDIEKQVGVSPLYYQSYATLYRPSVKDVIIAPVGATYDFKYAYKN